MPAKRVWTLTSLWTQRTRPQGTWKTADRFPQAPTPHLFFCQKERAKNGRPQTALPVHEPITSNPGAEGRQLPTNSPDEAFFKALKQNLRVKTFVGTSANALHIQVWTAVIALLILKYLQLKATFGWSLSNLVALLRMNLFVYRDLWSWLNEPFTAPPSPPEPQQGVLL